MKIALRILTPALISTATLFLAYQSGHQRAIVDTLYVVVFGAWLWAVMDGIRAVREWRNKSLTPSVRQDKRSPEAGPKEPPTVIYLPRRGARRNAH